MAIRLASWNIEGRLSDTGFSKRAKPKQIVAAIKKIDADLLVLLEAHSETSLNNLKPARQLTDMGYRLYNVPYEDDTALRKDIYTKRISLMLLSKLSVDKFEIIRLADKRNAFVAIIHKDKTDPFRLIGLHLDDRSESTRLNQVADLSKTINQSDLPTVVVGDFNAMHGDDLWPAKLLRSKPVRLLSKIILTSIFPKVIEMAQGKTLQLLQLSTNLRNADTRHRPTTTPKMRGREWLPSIRLIQIDHMFISPEIKVANFQIAPDYGADHRAIIATFSD